MDGKKELIVYRDLEKDDLFREFSSLLLNCGNGNENLKRLQEKYYECLNQLLEFAQGQGCNGNLWQAYLTRRIAGCENAYSKACEINGNASETLCQAAAHDFKALKELFDVDLHRLQTAFGVEGVDWISHFKGNPPDAKEKFQALTLRLLEAEDAKAFQSAVLEFYQTYGVGNLGQHRAFRIRQAAHGVELVPITDFADVRLSDLTGYEIAKQKLVENTEAFVNGRKANNCLLFGDAGTGKSTSVKAIASQYYNKGLRVVEIYKHQLKLLLDVIGQIKQRRYKFIIYMDDLSFEDFEVEYKYLKAVIEGGLEKKPENVLIYATSNRRHLIRESFSDKPSLSDDLHNNDTVQEKLSLAARFGVQIYFGAPDKKQFGEIVKALAKKHQIPIQEETLLAEAGEWGISHGGRSGRTAQQFIDYLLGKEVCV